MQGGLSAVRRSGCMRRRGFSTVSRGSRSCAWRADVVRHPLVQNIVDAYERDEDGALRVVFLAL
jgi:hypothetical protein